MFTSVSTSSRDGDDVNRDIDGGSVTKIDSQEHAIKSVTLFRSAKAEVVRAFTADLKEGQNEIELVNLPACLDTSSVRVHGLGTGNVTLFDVSTSRSNVFGRSNFGARRSAALQELDAKKTALQGERRIRDLQAAMLVKYSETLHAENIDPEKMQEFMLDFYDQGQANLGHIARIDKELIELEDKIQEEQLNGPSQSWNDKSKRTVKITLVLLAKAAGKLDFSLSYLVSDVSWEPVYDIRATTDKGVPGSSVTFHFRASIQQRTGEDWKNVSLKLSTAQGELETAVPAMRQFRLHSRSGKPDSDVGIAGHPGNADAWRSGKGFGNASLSHYQPQPNFSSKQQSLAKAHLFGQPQAQAPAFGQFVSQAPAPAFGQAPAPAFGTAATVATNIAPFSHAPPAPAAPAATGGLFGHTAAAPAVSDPAPAFASGSSGDDFVVVRDGATQPDEESAIQQLSESTATTSNDSLATTYQVEGQSTIPSDNSPHRVALTELTFEASPRYIAVPKIKKTVFLDCHVKNTSKHDILPGRVNIYLNESYVAKANLPHVAPQDSFLCSLGPDYNIRVFCNHEAVKLPRSTSRYAVQEETLSHTVTIKVVNKRQIPIARLMLRDMLPVTEEERIKIVLREPAELIDAKGDDIVDVKDGVKVRWRKLADGTSGEKQGWVEWLCTDIPANGELELQLQCDVTAPSDIVVLDPSSNGLYNTNKSNNWR